MSITIQQQPLYEAPVPVGQQLMFAVSYPLIVATKFKVKFIAEVHISRQAINLSNADSVVGTFKTTPNNQGVGIFDFRSIVETQVKPRYEGSTFANGSRYKGSDKTHPIHLIDECAVGTDVVKFFAVQFRIEYSDTAGGAVSVATGLGENSEQYTIFNGVLQYDNVLTLGKLNSLGAVVSGDNYGYDMSNFILNDTSSVGKFLSNAPTTQYATATDYGTLPFFNFLTASTDRVRRFKFRLYNDSDVLIDTALIYTGYAEGGFSSVSNYVDTRIMFLGAFPANLYYNKSDFKDHIDDGTLAYYTVVAEDAADAEISERYRINILCPNLKGYEPIRLTWLNQWGVWDYYTFNMKSTRSITTNRTSYTQQSGTWNESTFKIAGYKGGKKNFRVNSKEKITINTDFVTEAEGVWFKELINSTEVYILNGYSTDVANTITNKYVEPVTVTTSNYITKTIANDKLMQYTIEIEKSRMERTQTI
tara:strand:+ start:17906 stop:19336 length:1431 start_codon:yes stop_codon:yes gene_type:complete